MCSPLKVIDSAVDVSVLFIQRAARAILNGTKIDSDLECLHDHPRFKAILAAAETRLAAEAAAKSPPS
jgi:hypothetical protein